MGFYRRVAEEVVVMFDSGAYFTVPEAILRVVPATD